MTRCILVPVYARPSRAVIDRALRIAAEERGRVTVLALTGHDPVGMVHPSAPDAATMSRRAALARAVRDARAQAAERGIEIDVVSRSGSPIRALREEARGRAHVVVAEESLPWASRRSRGGGAPALGRELGCELVLVGDREPEVETSDAIPSAA